MVAWLLRVLPRVLQSPELPLKKATAEEAELWGLCHTVQVWRHPPSGCHLSTGTSQMQNHRTHLLDGLCKEPGPSNITKSLVSDLIPDKLSKYFKKVGVFEDKVVPESNVLARLVGSVCPFQYKPKPCMPTNHPRSRPITNCHCPSYPFRPFRVHQVMF